MKPPTEKYTTVVACVVACVVAAATYVTDEDTFAVPGVFLYICLSFQTIPVNLKNLSVVMEIVSLNLKDVMVCQIVRLVLMK